MPQLKRLFVTMQVNDERWKAKVITISKIQSSNS